MRSRDNILLVEGESDRLFFEAVRDRMDLRTAVQVTPPRDVGGDHNSKEGLLKHLPVLLNQLYDGLLKRLAVVIDADFVANSALGFVRTSERLEKLLNEAGFTRANRAPQHRGQIFQHTDGLADLGVWIMPNNRDDGALEDFLHDCVSPSERALYERAQATVHALPTPKFRSTARVKAEMSTWLAWQPHPGRGVHQALRDGLFALDCPAYAGLAEWLRHIYR
ncbi:MAG: hypothetical protein JNL82_05300 [Myxococcales bacterium]|nr:hypothetical protein [Myxococcales bacterium]